MQTGLRQGSACPPGSRRARRAVTRWLADPQVRSAAGLWLASKAMLAVLAWAASWVMRPAGQAAPLWAAWEHWDAAQFRLIAERGYGRLAGSDRIAFLPGFPLLLRAAHLLIGSWAADELVVTSAASFLAVLGLIRLADDCRPGSGTRAAVFLLASPAAVFLSVGYSEAAFLAAALPAWRAARAGRWTRAAVLAAVACAIRVSGIFVLAGLAVLAVQEVTSGLPAAARDATSRSRAAPRRPGRSGSRRGWRSRCCRWPPMRRTCTGGPVTGSPGITRNGRAGDGTSAIRCARSPPPGGPRSGWSSGHRWHSCSSWSWRRWRCSPARRPGSPGGAGGPRRSMPRSPWPHSGSGRGTSRCPGRCC